MAETNTATNTQESKAPVVASLGKVERVQPTLVAPLTDTLIVDTPAPAETKKEVTEPVFTDEQLASYFEKQGIKYEGLDKLKEKINYVPPTEVTETPEQKAAKELQKEKSILDLFIANGGTAEQFVAIKNIAKSDVTELSINETKAELKAAGFNDEQITAIIKERYYQIDDEEIEQLEDESDKEFKKRLKEYGAKKLANRSSYKQKQAEQVLIGLQKAIENSDLEKQEEIKFQSNVDETLKTLPRKVTYELGKIEDKEIAPIEHEVSEETITKVSAILKDPVQRNNFLYNKDGDLNLPNITELMVANNELKRALRGALLEGQSRQVAVFEATFPARSSKDVGVGGAPFKATTADKNRPASFGKVQRVQPSTT